MQMLLGFILQITIQISKYHYKLENSLNSKRVFILKKCKQSKDFTKILKDLAPLFELNVL